LAVILSSHTFNEHFARQATIISGVNFTNILCAAFMRTDPKSAKNTDSLTVFFCTFGICAHVKAACKTLMKLTAELVKRAHEHDKKAFSCTLFIIFLQTLLEFMMELFSSILVLRRSFGG